MMKSLISSIQRNIRVANRPARFLNSSRAMFTLSRRNLAITSSALHSYQKRDFIFPFGSRKKSTNEEQELRRRYQDEVNEDKKREIAEQIRKLEEGKDAEEMEYKNKEESTRRPDTGKSESRKAEESKSQRQTTAKKDEEAASSDEDLELTKEDIKKIQELIKEQDKKLDEQKKMIQSLRVELRSSFAETESTIQRYKKEVETTKEFAISKFAKDLIEITDTLNLALKHTNEKVLESTESGNNLKEPYTGLVEGVKLTHRTFENILKRHGVVEHDPLGHKFDPNIHEAMYVYEDPSKPPNTVGNVIQTGWKIGDRLLRAAKVGTIKPSSNKKLHEKHEKHEKQEKHEKKEKHEKQEDDKKIEKVMEEKKKEEKIIERIKETEPSKREEELLKKGKTNK